MQNSFGDIITNFFEDPFGSIINLGKSIGGLFSGNPIGGYTLSVFNVIRIIFIVLDILLLLIFIYSLFASLKFRPDLKHRKPQVKSRELILREKTFLPRWIKILETAKLATPEALKIAVIDADKLADDSLKQLGMKGETMADRIDEVTIEEIPSIDKLFKAHRIRNELVHNPDSEMSKHEAKKLLGDYEDFFRDINLFD